MPKRIKRKNTKRKKNDIIYDVIEELEGFGEIHFRLTRQDVEKANQWYESTLQARAIDTNPTLESHYAK